MAESPQACPCCSRLFERIFDYPRVRVLNFERLPVPEAMDDMSDAAAQKSLEWHRQNPSDKDWSRRGINMTPEIDRACQLSQVQEYLTQLEEFVGQEAVSADLLPKSPVDRTFKKAYPVANSPIFLSLDEGELSADGTRIVEVMTLCRGPSLGSAGGPTLMHLGPIARLSYEGLLTTDERTTRK